MSDHPYPIAYPQVLTPDALSIQARNADTACSTLVRLAAVGGLIAGSAAAAANLRRTRSGELEAGPAIVATARSAAIGATATAVAGAVAGAVAEQGLLRLGLMFAVGTAVIYGLDQWGGAGQGADDV